eukprot:SAG11_NODE_20842_length_437_cov_0.748521_2_plen_84_part_00
MTRLSDFNLSELGIFIGVCSSACVAVLMASQKSKCESVCFGMCKRRVDLVIADEKLQMTGKTGLSPKKESKDLKLEIEPEVEN